MDSKFYFDLQLFAEGEPAGDNVPAGGEPAPNTPNNPDNTAGAGTILGGAGAEPTNNPTTNNAGQPAGAPDAYDFSGIVPEGMEYDQQAATEYGNIARECGLTQEQASKIATYGMQFMQNGVNAAMQQIAATHAQWGEEAKRTLGGDFDKTVARAAVGINRLEKAVPNLRQVLNETGAGNRIEMIQLLAAIGDMVGEDGGHSVPGYGGEKSLYPNTNFGQYR
ncbi:MAG: hypothetical protein II651_06360 [Selenomonas sp.]|nr:hypothetical protein [Selenomonas sp.]